MNKKVIFSCLLITQANLQAITFTSCIHLMKHKFKKMAYKIEDKWATLTQKAPLQRTKVLYHSEINIYDMIGCPQLVELALDITDYITGKTTECPATGMLLIGPAQSGKSYFARTFRGLLSRQSQEINIVSFLAVSRTEIAQVGGIKNIFRIAEYYAPCVLYFDEVENMTEEETSALCDQVYALQTTKKDVKIIVLANALTDLLEKNPNKARIQNTFDKQIHLDYPCFENRLAYLEMAYKKRHIILADATTTEEIQELIHNIAKQTDGASYNILESIIRTALRSAMTEMRQPTSYDFQAATDKVKPQILRFKRYIQETRNL